MNENWPEIVETLIPYFETNSVEGDYQWEIENCLKFLGWKKTNGTMVSQYTLPIGNSNSIRPDIVLWRKNEHDTQSPVLPIEIKRPSNIRNERQENQLMSYMRQLKLNVGLYIGEKIQLYYDIPNDGENPICVFTAEIKKEDTNGSIICDLLSYDKFNLEKIETFCNEQYKKIQARNNLHRRVSEFLSEGNGVKNIISLLKDKFTAEGFEESAINEEFANLTLTVHYENKSILPSLQLKTRQTSKNSQNDYKESDSKDHTKFSLDGINFYVKRRFVLEVIKHYIKDHPNINYVELEKVFPSNLHSKALGVIRTLIEVQEKIKSHPDLKKRYFLKPDEVILLADGTKIVVNNQWGTLFPRFLEAAKKLYQVTNDTESNTPISRLKITFGNGKVIQETQAAETFRQFVMTVGVEQVQSLNIKVCKIPLISNTLHEKYQRAQKPLGNGRFLMTCSNTKTKKRDIERIAKALGIQVTVEIV